MVIKIGWQHGRRHGGRIIQHIRVIRSPPLALLRALIPTLSKKCNVVPDFACRRECARIVGNIKGKFQKRRGPKMAVEHYIYIS